MTIVEFTLPDDLAKDAAEAGLLGSEVFEEMLRRRLRAKAAGDLAALHQKAVQVETDEDFSPEAMAEEVRAMRAERQAMQKAS